MNRLIVISTLIFLAACNNPSAPDKRTDSLALRNSIPGSRVLTADSAIAKMHVQPGYSVQLVASEPLVAAPVALSFDEKGRIWAVEMMDYMPDTSGTGEDAPSGRIVILSDTNADGRMDRNKVFLDSLVLPRAICLIEDGILVAEPPKLWYYTIKDDKPVHKTLVDSDYAAGGNVEHQPNGLFRAMDNWIYNAKSAKRYKKAGNRWLIERTHFRGQWGISRDEYGRLYYNNNSENLLGDYFLPGLGATNPHQRNVAGFNEHIVPDNRVFPVRPTTGVNRGYQQGILDDSLRLREFTAACGPVIFNSAMFGEKNRGHAFIAEPAGNLIKEDILEPGAPATNNGQGTTSATAATSGFITKGKEAYEKKEFLASEDERFRPVNLYTGPDGALYIVDMYRGIIQHKTYLTTYLKNEIKQRALTKPLNCGRIYKVVPTSAGSPLRLPSFTDDPAHWVDLLQDPNGWTRDKAQQLLVDHKALRTAPSLRRLLTRPNATIPSIHALWTLEGIGALQPSDLLPLIKGTDPALRTQALTALPSIINPNNYRQFLPAINDIIAAKDTQCIPYIAFITPSIQKLDPRLAHDILIRLTTQYPNNIYIADAIISNLYNKEEGFYKEALAINPDTTLTINRQLKKVLSDIARTGSATSFKQLAITYPKGASIFQSLCQTCHGPDGNGIRSLGPPLNTSNWVLGDKNRLIPIVLYGLTGPVKVAGKLYKAPEVSGDMPGIGSNKEFSNEDIAQTLNFIRNAWTNKVKKTDKIIPEDIGAIREKFNDRQKPFTMEELR
ncbi:MAG: c-type cytochrome [Bacteroidetes bacterium]|nr:c-type cytochrome [Bacteroidota bacterium]